MSKHCLFGPIVSIKFKTPHIGMAASTSLQNIIIPNNNIMILFWKYLVDIRSEAWLNLFGEYINRKLFAV
jgi:hypothetical protein